MKNYKIIIIVITLLLISGVGYYFTNKYGSNADIKVSSSTYNGDGTKVDLNNQENTFNITTGGTYELTGTMTNGIVIESDDDVTLVLNGVSIIAEYPINIKQGDVKIVINDGSTNYVEYTKAYDENEEVNGAIYSKDDLVIEGNGSLEIKSTYNGIVSKDSVTIESGTITISAYNNGIKGKDSVVINGGNYTITAGNDAIKSTNEDDETLGYIEINGGTFNINSTGDGITAATNLTINNGDFTIKTGEGYVSTSKTADFNSWNNTTQIDDESIKGLKANTLITINGGTFNLNTEDDSIHSNGNIIIKNGAFTIKSSDDGIHADGLVEINGGTFDITASEGIEATYVKINDGTININATDDGINAANKSNNYKTIVEINGGNTTIKMGQGDTDGVDSNGDIIINGGTINVTGQSTFDYDGTGTINGGTVISNGEQITTLPNQFMGGGMQGQMGGNMQRGNMPQGNMGRGQRR